MNGISFTFAGTRLTTLPSGALHWPDASLLVVSDLHLGKSERMARRGGALLPPYETQATLTQLDADIAATAPAQVICLGDSFDDLGAAQALPEAELLWLTRLMAGRDWIWVEGNHDPGPLAIGGSHRTEVALAPLTFRHIASVVKVPEVSGHYHPKLKIAGVRRPCLVVTATKVIMPAYGTYTGGLDCGAEPLRGLIGTGARAILTGRTMAMVPL